MRGGIHSCGDKEKHGDHGATTDRYQINVTCFERSQDSCNNTNTAVHPVMKHAFECNRTLTLQEYCSSESDDCTCTSTTCVLTALSSNMPSRKTGTPRGWRATEFQMTATAVHRHLTSVRKIHLLYKQTHAIHKHSSHTSHTFYTNSSNIKALTTRVNIRLSQITLELFRECNKSTLILG